MPLMLTIMVIDVNQMLSEDDFSTFKMIMKPDFGVNQVWWCA